MARPVPGDRRRSGSAVGCRQLIGLRAVGDSLGSAHRPARRESPRPGRRPGGGPPRAVEQPQDHLDARQVDAQVALEAHDRPEPADLGRLVALISPSWTTRTSPSDSYRRRIRGETDSSRATRSRGMIGRVMAGTRSARTVTTARRGGCTDCAGRIPRSDAGSPRRRLLGTTILSTTNRSPAGWPPEAGTPCPRRRSFCPLEVPAGMVSDFRPSGVGTSIFAPRMASPTVIGTSTSRSRPSRRK